MNKTVAKASARLFPRRLLKFSLRRRAITYALNRGKAARPA